MTEEFSASTAAKILRELCALYDPPEELNPSLRQWRALVEACGGAVSRSNFGLILSELARMCLLDSHRNLRSSSAPENIAKVLKGLFDVSNSVIERLHISGGADCAWLAAVAHWLLGLRVTVEDQFGNVIYRPGNFKSTTVQDSQVIICYGTAESETSSLVRRAFVVPSGQLLVSTSFFPDEDLLAHGRLSWSTCLRDAFGSKMKLLLTSYASHAGACLGSAARIFEHIACDSDRTVLSKAAYGGTRVPCHGGFGRGFMAQARDRFPELCDAPRLIQVMESIYERSLDATIREFTESINSIQAQCQCDACMENEESNGSGTEQVCMVVLVFVLCDFIRLSSQIAFQKNLSICPTLTGMELMYIDKKRSMSDSGVFRGSEGISSTSFYAFWADSSLTVNGIRVLAQTWLCNGTHLESIRILFTGRGQIGLRSWGMKGPSAFSAEGICVYSNSLCEMSLDPERACSMYVVPGRIQWNDYLYGEIWDSNDGHTKTVEGQKWESNVSGTVTAYDDLKDSSTPNIQVKLLIEEYLSQTQRISSKWLVSSARGSWSLGPRDMNLLLAKAYCGKVCGTLGCSSLNGFRSIVVEGDGEIRSEQICTDDGAPVHDPIIRVLTGSPAAVWVALSQRQVTSPTDRLIFFHILLQGKQCTRCAVTGTLKWFNEGNSGPSIVRQCLLTSV
jgi:hypothetical protein